MIKIRSKFTPPDGFMLIEAMLAMALMGSMLLFVFKEERRQNEIDDIRLLGKDISSLMLAVDRRVLIDGYYTDGGWERDSMGWQDTSELFRDILIGRDNLDCGHFDSWEPRDDRNSALALVDCAILNQDMVGFEFYPSAEIRALEDDINTLYSVELVLRHRSQAKFGEYFHMYAKLVESFNLNTPLQMTGVQTANLMDNGSMLIVSPTQCLELGVGCSIRFKYESNLSGTGEDVYLRVDGGNSMRNSLRFRVNSMPAQCTRVDSEHVSEVVSCGFDFDTIEDEVNVVATSLSSSLLNTDDAYSGSYLLSPDLEHLGAPVLCYNEEGESACGVTVVKRDDSYLAKATLNALHVNNLINLYNSDGEHTISINSEGSITAYNSSGDEVYKLSEDGNIEANHLKVNSLDVTGVISANSTSFQSLVPAVFRENASFFKDVGVVGDVRADGLLESKSGVIAGGSGVRVGSAGAVNFDSGGSIGVNNSAFEFMDSSGSVANVKMGRLKVASNSYDGQSCSYADVGTMVTTSSGVLLTCRLYSGSYSYRQVAGSSEAGYFRTSSDTISTSVKVGSSGKVILNATGMLTSGHAPTNCWVRLEYKTGTYWYSLNYTQAGLSTSKTTYVNSATQGGHMTWGGRQVGSTFSVALRWDYYPSKADCVGGSGGSGGSGVFDTMGISGTLISP